MASLQAPNKANYLAISLDDDEGARGEPLVAKAPRLSSKIVLTIVGVMATLLVVSMMQSGPVSPIALDAVNGNVQVVPDVVADERNQQNVAAAHAQSTYGSPSEDQGRKMSELSQQQKLSHQWQNGGNGVRTAQQPAVSSDAHHHVPNAPTSRHQDVEVTYDEHKTERVSVHRGVGSENHAASSSPSSTQPQSQPQSQPQPASQPQQQGQGAGWEKYAGPYMGNNGGGGFDWQKYAGAYGGGGGGAGAGVSSSPSTNSAAPSALVDVNSQGQPPAPSPAAGGRPEDTGNFDWSKYSSQYGGGQSNTVQPGQTQGGAAGEQGVSVRPGQTQGGAGSFPWQKYAGDVGSPSAQSTPTTRASSSDKSGATDANNVNDKTDDDTVDIDDDDDDVDEGVGPKSKNMPTDADSAVPNASWDNEAESYKSESSKGRVSSGDIEASRTSSTSNTYRANQDLTTPTPAGNTNAPTHAVNSPDTNSNIGAQGGAAGGDASSNGYMQNGAGWGQSPNNAGKTGSSTDTWSGYTQWGNMAEGSKVDPQKANGYAGGNDWQKYSKGWAGTPGTP